MPFFLAIDGGGTQTECLVADEASVLAHLTAPSCKIQVVGEERARTVLQAAIREVCGKAGVNPQQITRSCAGMSGTSRSDIPRLITEMIREVAAGEIQVVGDNAIAMEAAFAELPGVIVIAGTGSIAFGRNRNGEQARAGGWGAAISDEGSGGWIGRQAAANAMRAFDESHGEVRGDDSGLLAAVMRAWNAATPEEIPRIANSVPAPDFAALFPVVLEAANAHDHVAAAILTRAGEELAQLAAIVMQKLWPGRQTEGVRVRMAGGVFRHSALVRSAFFSTLRGRRADAAVNFVIVDPVSGALAMARRAALDPVGTT
jgi:glucosamine kinase